MSKVFYVIDEFGFLPDKVEKQKYNADNTGPVGEQGPAWYDDYTIEELLERIIDDAYALGNKIGHPPMRELVQKMQGFPQK